MDASLPKPESLLNEKCTMNPEIDCQANDKLDKILRQLDVITKAFPQNALGEPDIAGHRMGHEKQIEAAEANRAFWVGMRNDVIRRGILWGIILVGGLIATGAMLKFRTLVMRILSEGR